MKLLGKLIVSVLSAILFTALIAAVAVSVAPVLALGGVAYLILLAL